MDPLSALSIATGIITFADFGAKLVSLYLEIRQSEDGRPAELSALQAESRDLSGNASQARETVASLQARYPQQSESLARLTTECTQAEKELRSLADSLTAKPGHGLRARGAQALVSVRGVLKQGDVEGLQGRLRSIREQTMMSVIMCIL
jgi:chromosome segregation ATPase